MCHTLINNGRINIVTADRTHNVSAIVAITSFIYTYITEKFYIIIVIIIIIIAEMDGH